MTCYEADEAGAAGGATRGADSPPGVRPGSLRARAGERGAPVADGGGTRRRDRAHQRHRGRTRARRGARRLARSRPRGVRRRRGGSCGLPPGGRPRRRSHARSPAGAQAPQGSIWPGGGPRAAGARGLPARALRGGRAGGRRPRTGGLRKDHAAGPGVAEGRAPGGRPHLRAMRAPPDALGSGSSAGRPGPASTSRRPSRRVGGGRHNDPGASCVR